MSEDDHHSGTNGDTPPSDRPTSDFLLPFNTALRSSKVKGPPPDPREARRDISRRYDDRPEIMISTDEFRVNGLALKALASDPDVFQRGDMLVRVISDGGKVAGIRRPAESPRIALLTPPVLREHLTKMARFVTVKEKDGLPVRVDAHPPTWCVQAVHARRSYPVIRPLKGIVESPFLRADGSICDTAGYDVATGLLYVPNGQPPIISANPSHDDALRARDLLLDLVCDFPFENDAHRATWLSALLTPVGRPAFEGPVPLFLFGGNVAGCGKTLLPELISLILTRREIARTPNPRNDEEWRKMVLAVAISGERLILVDNVSGQFGSAALDAALTGTCWRDRILGRSQIVTMPLAVTWFASGNNVMLRGDICRRVAHCRLNCKDEHPEERDGFKYPDLRAHVRQHRGELLGAVLTILRAYFLAHPPKSKLRPWGSYEGWDLIRQCVVWLGQPDPGSTRDQLRSKTDRDSETLTGLFAGFSEADPTGTGMTTADIIEATAEIIEGTDHPRYPTLRRTVYELCDASLTSPPSARSLGNKLRHLIGRVFGGRALDMREAGAGFARWRVISTASLGGPSEVGEDSTDA